MQKNCPFCGAKLPEEASFCPFCAKGINERTAPPKAPKRIPIRILRRLCLIAALFLFALFLFFKTGPRRIDGMGELSYTDADGSYQLLLSLMNDRYAPMDALYMKAGAEDSYRFPLCLYVNLKDSGADAGGMFLQKVARAEITAEAPKDAAHSPKTENTSAADAVQCTEPAASEAIPGAALVSFIDYTRRSPENTQLVWTLHMKNGDRLTLRTNMEITPVSTYEFSEENADLESAEALQALIDQIAADPDIGESDTVSIRLPAVVYSEPVVLHSRTFNLTGSEENGQRTTFTAGIQIKKDTQNWISYLNGLDFIGNGTGVALSTGSRAWPTDCRFQGWKTAVLCFGNAWVNLQDCTLSENGIGLHFNSEGNPADTRFTNNRFIGNQTAVLLENVSGDVRMDFSETVFRDNETDIDNRCGQPVDISQAVFQ